MGIYDAYLECVNQIDIIDESKTGKLSAWYLRDQYKRIIFWLKRVSNPEKRIRKIDKKIEAANVNIKQYEQLIKINTNTNDKVSLSSLLKGTISFSQGQYDGSDYSKQDLIKMKSDLEAYVGDLKKLRKETEKEL